MSTLISKLETVINRHEELQSIMSEHPNPGSPEYTALTKEYSELDNVVPQLKEMLQLHEDIAEMEEILADASADKDMKDLAKEELPDLRSRYPELEQQVQIALLPRDEADARNAILEVRAGTGGDEAGLFAGDLLRMYERYAGTQGWRVEVISSADTGIGGVKEASIMVTGTNVFQRLKYESGVHRVQRVPETESGGRVHTSAATVAVLPEAQEIDVKINPADLKIDTYRASGAGGQHVNTTDSAVRITHIPTGTVVEQQDERSQHKNRDKAMKVLLSRIYEKQREAADAERSEDRKAQVGSGDRSERIRTYNYPQGRVTDHRINLTLYKLDQIVQGEALDEMIDALITEDQAARLAALADG